jgi:hypothetical protein
MAWRVLFFTWLLSSCSNDHSDIQNLSRVAIFHGNSSKIWVINKVTKKGVNYAAYPLKEKDVAIFYDDQTILIQPMKSLGEFPNRSGILSLSDDNSTCEFRFPKENWIFEVKEISSKRILLHRKAKSDFNYDLELIAYPKSDYL